MLEIKANNQEHKRKCSQKKGLKNFFSDDLQKKKQKKVFKAIHKISTI